jgi:long-chain acyl-CoA synthetase
LIRPSVLISVRPAIILQRVLFELRTVTTLNAQVPTLFNKIYSGIKAGVKNSPPLKQKAFDLAMKAGRTRREWINSHPGRTAADLPFHLKASYAIANKVVFSKIMQKFGGNLRFCMSGGAPLSNDIQDFFADMGIPILEGYGLTETSPLVVCEQFAATEKRQGGLKPIPGVIVTIRDANGEELQQGSEGEICVEGPNVMVGYLGNAAETEKVIMNVGGRRVFKTGDMGKFADDGRVLITGRIKEQ